MKEKAELIRNWLRKAASDGLALNASLTAGAFDAACFHAQQAAERYLKAYLIHENIEFPFTHNLAKLIELCAAHDASFRSLMPAAESLTPYAVVLRYDEEFWPTTDEAHAARTSVEMVKNFVLTRLTNYSTT